VPRARISQQTSTPPPTANPDQAWKALSLVVDWIKHADAKAAATLASSGVVATVLYNLVKGEKNPPHALIAFSTACGLFVSAAALCAGWALRPRLRSREAPTSPLYYHHIARRYTRSIGGAPYVDLLNSLAKNNDDLTREIAWQVWANAHVAREKYRWGNYGLLSLLFALPSLAATAITIYINSR
jgi:hypothetical protein